MKARYIVHCTTQWQTNLLDRRYCSRFRTLPLTPGRSVRRWSCAPATARPGPSTSQTLSTTGKFIRFAYFWYLYIKEGIYFLEIFLFTFSFVLSCGEFIFEDVFETVFELRKKRMNMVCNKKILCITFEKGPFEGVKIILFFSVVRFSRITNTNICLTSSKMWSVGAFCPK